ncbi:MAG TPA: GNAT family N-acetyltransferase [Candidatus Pullichristensenella stercorigallinarum]|uniref:GNAT family N-acetyltransferase n=1 Tax=Candidatus Pullichristensenella stercorigallinarum TaxID=2840909 RepID=A0A9D0ZJ28_9FIRM|nr:GNAT family N-acetyltransferase [Candidatus Pullichristensenella stercorigallinarum]
MALRLEAASAAWQAEIVRLFAEYTNAILQNGEEVRRCLHAQGYDAEAQSPLEKYAPPRGRLYIALWDGVPCGCAALRGLEGEFCEMKRLYVRPGNRGRHIGGALVERLIADARDIGYRHMRLDTFPFMESAIRLYRRYGFYDIARYNDNPAPTALFMQLDL